MNPSRVTPMERLAAASLSQTGLEWAVERLDPGGCHCSSPGVPDRVSSPRVVLPRRTTDTVSSGMSLAEGETWDIALVGAPMMGTALMLCRKKSSADWPTNFIYTNHKSGTSTSGWKQTVASNAEFFIWSYPDSNFGGEIPSLAASSVRLVSRSVTSELVGPQLYRSGTVTSGQYPVEVSSSNWGLLDSTPATFGTYPANLIRFPALEPSIIVTYDKLAGQRQANLGDYNVTRFTSSTGVSDVLPAIQARCYFYPTDKSVSDLVYDEDVGPGAENWIDTVSPSANMSVTVYSGLSPQDVLRVKVCGTQEIYPLPHSPLVSLTTVNPPLDQGAIDLVSEIEAELPHSYPSDYNDLGGLLGVIGRFFRDHGVPAARIIGGLGIPIVSPIGQAIGSLASAFGR